MGYQDYLIMIGQLMLSLSILIVLHEMGHFFPARWFNTRVEKFYLFFNPWFSLFKIKRGETEYGIGWLPLGGYVKISGMIDESFDKDQMKEPPKPYEFRSKPAWQRLIIMLGGVTVNFILGFFLYGMVLWIWGEEYLPSENAQYGIFADSLGTELGFQDGDKIISVGNVPFERFNDRTIVKEIVINNAEQIKVIRGDQEKIINVDPKFVDILTRHENKNKRLFYPRYPFIAEAIAKDSPAEKAGILKGDKIIGFDTISTPFFNDFLVLAMNNKNKDIEVTVERNGQPKKIDLTVSEDGKIGVYPRSPGLILGTDTTQYSFFEAMPAGVINGWNFLTDQIKAFGQIFSGKIKAKESLGGFGTIGSMFGNVWYWDHFWRMTAILSLILAFMNLLPIPALDGGHVMFLLFESVTGIKPSDRVVEVLTLIGFVLIISLVLYANGLDIVRGWFSE